MAKLTPKQEKFCQKYIELGNASEAYRQSYDCSRMKSETINRKAKVEYDKGKIRARINELQEEHRERHNVTIDSLIEELEQARIAALSAETPQSSAAVSATLGKAKLLGIGKREEIENALKQAELEQMKDSTGDNQAMPVNVIVEVKDARRHAEPKHTTSEILKPTE